MVIEKQLKSFVYETLSVEKEADLLETSLVFDGKPIEDGDWEALSKSIYYLLWTLKIKGMLTALPKKVVTGFEESDKFKLAVFFDEKDLE